MVSLKWVVMHHYLTFMEYVDIRVVFFKLIFRVACLGS